ncbi:hypothetical protein H7J86_15000 [Mycobacterium hackensackense]|uniref:hypothetical protein n=1 Tax=Mycobacterium hackensackense TaxID=228909 RepID=UPI0022659142|nr:hypothetical protein [Mycobacterium hackensackense]MCV7253472.1 hypothetical protein [Mycobacterium hackensackense]
MLNHVDQRTGKSYGPWRTMHVPVPDKLWLAPEAAERKGGQFLLNASNQIASAAGDPLPFTPLQDLINVKQLALRTYAIRSNDFKANLAARTTSEAIQTEYRLARFPRFIWVVEAIDRQLRKAGKPCVVGEAVLDATSSDHDPQEIALHIHGVMWLQQTNGNIRFPITGDAQPHNSGDIGTP